MGINYFRGLEGAQATEESIRQAEPRHTPTVIQADLASEDAVDAMFERFLKEMGGIDILITMRPGRASVPPTRPPGPILKPSSPPIWSGPSIVPSAPSLTCASGRLPG